MRFYGGVGNDIERSSFVLNVNYIYVSLFRFYSARVNSQIPIECVCSPGFIVPERLRPIALYRQHKKKKNETRKKKQRIRQKSPKKKCSGCA